LVTRSAGAASEVWTHEEPLSEPTKHLLISSDGRLLQIVNMEELVDFAIETAILQRGAQITPEEKAQYRAMLIETQKQTLTKAVQCDLGFIWASWVQHWTSRRKTGQKRSEREAGAGGRWQSSIRSGADGRWREVAESFVPLFLSVRKKH
jgi:hypothetical protein